VAEVEGDASHRAAVTRYVYYVHFVFPRTARNYNIHKTFSMLMPFQPVPCRYVADQLKVKGKVFPYSLPSVGPGADPGVQAVSPQVT